MLYLDYFGVLVFYCACDLAGLKYQLFAWLHSHFKNDHLRFRTIYLPYLILKLLEVSRSIYGLLVIGHVGLMVGLLIPYLL